MVNDYRNDDAFKIMPEANTVAYSTKLFCSEPMMSGSIQNFGLDCIDQKRCHAKQGARCVLACLDNYPGTVRERFGTELPLIPLNEVARSKRVLAPCITIRLTAQGAAILGRLMASAA